MLAFGAFESVSAAPGAKRGCALLTKPQPVQWAVLRLMWEFVPPFGPMYAHRLLEGPQRVSTPEQAPWEATPFQLELHVYVCMLQGVPAGVLPEAQSPWHAIHEDFGNMGGPVPCSVERRMTPLEKTCEARASLTVYGPL